MNKEREDHLNNQEKTLIAMGAAMGAGCRTCADKLYEIAAFLKIPEKEMQQVFHSGLEAKAEAVRTMEKKISALLPDEKANRISFAGENPKKLVSLVRIASFFAANSAPDVLSEIQRAQGLGATPEQIKMCVSLAGMVRKNAQAFSDREVSEGIGIADPGEEEICCPPGHSKGAPACSCG